MPSSESIVSDIVRVREEAMWASQGPLEDMKSNRRRLHVADGSKKL